ncbi:ATPase/histidine kinase/DNA gyrase B/HSP90 domain protein [Subdoligranulum variabile DSM 15176]|uniref:histidine kinase n=1 Tax=Subdoligranulum variabile DSM 15176 TaxID=411471 RepID=D1PPK9_9FIRM|nr:ATPase/histidine kinase/DNA gyrase B/HSP90 domain protein [Subdoligranulum variabile DSM 15176]
MNLHLTTIRGTVVFAPQDMMQGLFSCSHISVILLCKKKEGLRAVKLGASRYPLKKVFYRTFSLLVVVPLILVSVAAAIILYRVMRSSTVDTVSAFQETVATTLDNDIRSASLQLSHFVYVNDGEFLDVVNQVYQSTGSSQQYLANKALERSFNTAMVPSQNILAGRFFMKGGGAVSVKDAITLPDDEMRAEGWYRAALETPNRVTIGGYDTSKTDLTANTQKGRQLVLVTAMAPDYSTDRSGSIDVVAYFTNSQVSEVLLRARTSPDMGTTVLLNESGGVLFGDMGREPVLAWFGENGAGLPDGTFNQRAVLEEDGSSRNYIFIVREVPYTGWRIVTFVDEARILNRITATGALLAGVVFGLLLLFYLFSRYFLDAIVMPVQALAVAMDRVADNDLDVQLQPAGHQELRRLTDSFNQMVLSLKNMLAINEEAQKRKHQAEIQALQSQINPHFIVNTLNSIRFMAQMSGYDGIRRMAQALASIVSCSFRSSTSFYTVREELEMLDSYLYIMRIRYADGFEVRYEVADECRACRLPRLTLQPIVENALNHGFADLGEELGQLVIRAAREADALVLEVTDNGCGMDAATVKAILHDTLPREQSGSSIGIQNVLARLRLHFGGAAGLQIDSTPGRGTCVRLALPWEAVAPLPRKEEETHDPHTDC